MSEPSERPRRPETAEPLVVFAVFAVFTALFGWGAATTAQGGDASEFMAIAAGGGVAHPPGYPLFSLLVKAAARVPIGTVAWRVSMVAALQGAAALAILYALVRQLTGRILPGVLAAGSLGLSLHFWRYATVSEVFMGGALTAALTLAASLHAARVRGGPAAALLFGLALASGIANHHTVVLLFPLGFYTLAVLLRGRRPVASILAGAAGLVPGFLAYLTLMIPGGVWRWGDTTTPDGLLHHFLRRDYGTFRLAISDVEVPPWEHPLHWLTQLPHELFGVFALLGLLGLAVGWRRDDAWERWWVLAAGASVFTAGPLFLSAFNLPLTTDFAVVTSRFHILPNTLLAVFVGLGAAWALARVRSPVVGAALALGLVGPLLVNWQKAPHRGWTVLEDYMLNSLSAVEPGALILGAGDPTLFGMVYVQQVMGVRPDVAFVAPNMVPADWYRAQESARHPDLVLTSADGRPLAGVDLVRANLSRPVYLRFTLLNLEPFSGLGAMWPTGAVLMRAAPEGTPLPHPGAVEAEMRAALAGHTLRSRVETPFQAEHTWEYKDYDQYALAFDTLANAWEAEGDAASAARCRATAAELSPLLFGAEQAAERTVPDR